MINIKKISALIVGSVAVMGVSTTVLVSCKVTKNGSNYSYNKKTLINAKDSAEAAMNLSGNKAISSIKESISNPTTVGTGANKKAYLDAFSALINGVAQGYIELFKTVTVPGNDMPQTDNVIANYNDGIVVSNKNVKDRLSNWERLINIIDGSEVALTNGMKASLSNAIDGFVSSNKSVLEKFIEAVNLTISEDSKKIKGIAEIGLIENQITPNLLTLNGPQFEGYISPEYFSGILSGVELKV